MRILLASSEVHPFSKTGGLADMVGALAKALAASGDEAAIVTPLYRGILERFPAIRPIDYAFDLPLGARWLKAGAFVLDWAPRLRVYFVDHREFYHRGSLYQEGGRDYPDNAERFIFFSKCVTHLARYLDWRPDIVHVHDWQVGLVPLLMLEQKWRGGWGSVPPSCLTIHNLAYQGVFDRSAYGLTNLPWDHFHPGGAEFHGTLNCLKAGIAFADVLTTVSPRYAREILTEAFGCGLDGVLRVRQNALSGILNGVDYSEWNTTRNPHLSHDYTFRKLRGKAEEKAALQAALGLPQRADVPLFANISRLTDQKGNDFLLGALEEMLGADLQFVLLGSGHPSLEHAYQMLARRFPTQVAVRIGYDHALSHRIEAGADFFLMPSRFEPCGLNQMYSLRYGTIPIVRATGGLDDSVVDATEDVARADGIKFTEPSARALAKAMRKALVVYGDPELLRRFRRNGMSRDFSWERTTDAYRAVYQKAMGG